MRFIAFTMRAAESQRTPARLSASEKTPI